MSIQIPLPPGAASFALVFLVVFFVIVIVCGILLWAILRVLDEWTRPG